MLKLVQNLKSLIKKINSFFSKSWIWLKRNYKGILIFVSSVLVLLGLLRYRKNSPEFAMQVRKLDIVKEKQEIENLKAKKAELKINRAENNAELKVVDEKIKEIDSDIKKSKKEISHMDIDEKIKKFDELGY